MTDGDDTCLGHFIKEELPEASIMPLLKALALQVFKWWSLNYRVTKAKRSDQMDNDFAVLTLVWMGHNGWLTTANLFCNWWYPDHDLNGELLARL